MNDEIRYGEIAYNAYCATRGWKSFNGTPLPKFHEQAPDLQTAWNVAAQAIIERHEETLPTNP